MENLSGYLYAPVVLLSEIDPLILLIRELAGLLRQTTGGREEVRQYDYHKSIKVVRPSVTQSL